LLSSSIVDQYYTQIIGNPNSLPVLKATPGFTGFGLIDGDRYYTENLNWGSTNVFWRQVRNFVFDITSVPISSSLSCIHWPTAQATSLQNIIFQMSPAAGTQHVGIFCESGMYWEVSFFSYPSQAVNAEVESSAILQAKIPLLVNLSSDHTLTNA
jgi:glucan 1,3-beta-glucosidase